MENNLKFKTPDFTVNRFSLKLLNKMELYLKEKVYNQDEAINSIINVFKTRIIPSNDLPLVLLFNGNTGVGKSYIANLISDFLQKETGEYDIYEIACNTYNSAEFTSLWGTASGFSNNGDKAIMEGVVEKMYKNNLGNGGIIVYLTEIGKVSTNSNIISGLNHVLRILMQNFESRFHNFKGGTSLGNLSVDTTNIIYILDDNLLENNIEYQKKIGFYSNEELKIDKINFEKENTIGKKELISYLEKELEPSIFNRLNQSKYNIIQFNSIDNKFIEKIFNLEFRKLENTFLDYIKDEEDFRNYLNKFQKKKKNIIKEMIGKISINKYGGRAIRNYIHQDLKLQILNEVEGLITYN